LFGGRDTVLAATDADDADGAPQEEGSMVEEGKPAPDFTLASDTGERIQLSSLRGRPVVLYFYPKDDTPGCTKQACGIRDSWNAFEERGAVVLGVSPDDEDSHVQFKSKFELPFTLLADVGHKVADSYGVWGELTFDGQTFPAVIRSTFVIDENGDVAKIMRNVDPESHAADVLAAL
jgi:peroxiredoxin Q/BCP